MRTVLIVLFDGVLQAQTATRKPIRHVQQWITEHPADDLSVEALALRANLSPRQFAGAFAAEVGLTPGRYVDRVRVEAARRCLEDSADGVEAQASFADVPHPDVIVMPGGSGEAAQLSPGPLQDWLLEADKTSTWTTSVCTGALILARAGLLAAGGRLNWHGRRTARPATLALTQRAGQRSGARGATPCVRMTGSGRPSSSRSCTRPARSTRTGSTPASPGCWPPVPRPNWPR